MNRRAVQYKGSWLDPNSKAYQLFQDRKMRELDEHLAKTDRRAKALERGDMAEYHRNL